MRPVEVSRVRKLFVLSLLSLLSIAFSARADEGFQFGSYGRVGISTDLDGARGKPHNVVSRGTRLEEQLYAEMDFRYRLRAGDMKVMIHATLGFFDDFFHFTGEPTSTIALRNLYAEFSGVLTKHLTLWAGSRMYRGDDIYLFDFWPLDNLNTLGGGFILRFGDKQIDELKVHVGASQLNDPYQRQVVRIARPDFGVDELIFNDRQKMVLSTKYTHEWLALTASLGAKAIFWGELHYLPSGALKLESGLIDPLPSDLGGVVGGQFGIWSRQDRSFLNFFVRGGFGLAAYGDLSVPFGLGTDKKSTGARDFLMGISANLETKRVGLMAGTYLRYFKDADPNAFDRDDGWEFALAVRPHIYVYKHFQQVFELSYQERRPNGLSPQTGTFLRPRAFQLAIMPTISVGNGSYTRPQFRLVYALTFLNDGARDLYPVGDVRRGQSVQHLLGFMVEWWFQGSYRYQN